MNPCECGCGQEVARRFVHGHNGRLPTPRECSVVTCHGRAHARGLCGTHYQRQYKHGDASHVSDKVRNRENGNALVERCKTPEALLDGECWEWTGAIGNWGYGHKQIRGAGSTAIASRAIWIEVFGPIEPASLFVLHKCDNPPCVRPSHLFLGTQKDNIHDMLRKGREDRRYGNDHHATRLTDAQIAEIRELRANSSLYLREIGALFGVDGSHIGKIVRRQARTVPAKTVRSEHRTVGYGQWGA